ncbi:hypothetical protein C8R46DRAFT_449657 [Mycena filopes]|nr:hypothetical protein C8R46DRAFT_449657 [Mycena filopes]
MASADERSADGLDDLPSFPASTNVSPLYSHVQSVRTKRIQVKNACTKCQKACKKCDPARPCLRCVRYGYGPECVDSQRKERRVGAKRGPYRKHDRKGKSIAEGSQKGELESESLPPPSTSQHAGPVVEATTSVGYVPASYSQSPLPSSHNLGAPAYYHYFYPAPATPTASDTRQEGEGATAPPLPQIFPATLVSPYVLPYIVNPRPDGHITSYAGIPFAGSADMNAKPPLVHDDRVETLDTTD